MFPTNIDSSLKKVFGQMMAIHNKLSIVRKVLQFFWLSWGLYHKTYYGRNLQFP